jgi:hypothetical protein
MKSSDLCDISWHVGLISCPIPKLEDHLLSAAKDYLFSMPAATLHIWRSSPRNETRGCAVPCDKGAS